MGQPGLLAHGSDPGDAVFCAGGGCAARQRRCTGRRWRTVEVREPDVNAIVSPSYAYRVQRAALQAAGGNGCSPSATGRGRTGGACGEGLRLQRRRWIDCWRGGASVHLIFWLPVLVVGGLVGSGLLRAMTRKRLMTQGLTAVAKITGVSDTGVTVNKPAAGAV